MNSITVLESESGGIARLIDRHLRDIRRAVGNVGSISFMSRSCFLSGGIPDLLVLTANPAEVRAEATRLKCGRLLIPGNAALPAELETGCVISYGMSTRDSITLSSIDERGIVLSLQRELPTVTGDFLERQDIPVRILEPSAPEELMACAASLLLLGVSAELLM